MTKYIDVEDMLDKNVSLIKEVYHIYFHGKRIRLNYTEYASIRGAKTAIRNYFGYFRWYSAFPHLSKEEVIQEVFKHIEIRKVTY